MAITPMAVFADETDPSNAGDTVTGSGTIEGWVDTEQFCVTLPTVDDTGLAFKIDPQGLSTIASGAVADTGLVLFEDTSKVELVNKSSFAVGFDVKVSLKTTDDGLKVVASDAVDDGTDRNIYLAAQPIDVSLETPAVIEGKDIPVVAVTPSEGKIGEVAFAYALKDAADQYEYKNESGYSFSLKSEASDFDKVAFGFYGEVNPNADWSAYAASSDAPTMSLEVVYSVEKLGVPYTESSAPEMVDGVPGLLTATTAPKVNKAPAGPATATTTLTTTASVDAAKADFTGFNLGAGTLAATDIASVKIGTINLNKLASVPTAATLKGYMFDAASGKLTVYGNNFATAKDYTLTVTFNDSASTVVTVTVTASAE